MKPYALAFRNFIRLKILKIRCPKLNVGQIILLSRNSSLTFHKSAEVVIGEHFINDGRISINVDKDAELCIGKSVYFNEDSSISCKGKITIGDGCNFGPGVRIFDNNHRFNAAEGLIQGHNYGEIIIGEKSWIGANVVILKGAKIGRHCVIGAGCVIESEIPDASIVKQERKLSIETMR